MPPPERRRPDPEPLDTDPRPAVRLGIGVWVVLLGLAWHRKIRAGARGYVTKAISGPDLSDAIRRVAGGDAVFSPRLAGFVLDAFGAAAGDIATGDDELDRLSAREREVMRLIARGYSYREVASELFISIKTVETHVSAVLRKLQLSSRHELTRWAAARRLL